MTNAIVFDFDGVLVDSNRLKKESFFNLFPERDEKLHAVIENARTKGRTRFEAFRIIFTELKQKNIETKIEEYAERYDRLVQEGIRKMGLVPEAPEVLETLADSYPLYINSATPETALRNTVRALDIEQFFRGVLGAPASKEENLEIIIREEKTYPHHVVFVGDAESDYRAAAAVGCSFIGVVNDFNKWSNASFPLIHDLNSLKVVLRH